MRGLTNSTFFVIRKTAGEWIEQDIHRLGAALSFYALFSIPPLFVIVLAISGIWFGDEAARRELFGQVSSAVGHQGSDALQSLVSVAHTENRSPWAAIIAMSILLTTATGTFVELQSSLNTIWGVRRKPGRGIQNVVKDRLLSFSLIVGCSIITALLFNPGKYLFGQYLIRIDLTSTYGAASSLFHCPANRISAGEKGESRPAEYLRLMAESAKKREHHDLFSTGVLIET